MRSKLDTISTLVTYDPFQEKELLTAFIQKVKENEPGVQVFELDLDRNRSQFLTFEVYVYSLNSLAFECHLFILRIENPAITDRM